MEISFSLDEINIVAKTILKQNPHKVILLEGEMGAGKTTLIKSLISALGIIENISSPTFSLVNEYQNADKMTIYHFDFYRIKNELEAIDIGIEEYLYSGNWCFIEWSEKIPSLLPEKYSKISIKLDIEGNRYLRFIKN